MPNLSILDLKMLDGFLDFSYFTFKLTISLNLSTFDS